MPAGNSWAGVAHGTGDAELGRHEKTAADDPLRELCLHQLFEQQAERRPDAIALVHRDRRLSYRQLNERANQLARYLINRFKIGSGSLVGICMHRSPELVVGILAVLKAGAAYVPLDATYPKKRLVAMFEDIDLGVLLTQNPLLFGLPSNEIATVCVDTQWPAIARESFDNLPGPVPASNLAYVVFTSGSTGRPKAAGVFHRGWTNLMSWFAAEFKIGTADKVLVVSSFGFDITQRSIIMPLMTGGELHLLDTDSFDPALVRYTISERHITLMNCAPSMFYLLIEDVESAVMDRLDCLRVLFLGGEAISGARLRRWAEGGERSTEIANVYGVAECSDVSSFYRMTDCSRHFDSMVPIGKPIANTEIHLVDENLAPVPFGAAGEICIAGAGVGKGYINDPVLTADKFIRNPFDRLGEQPLYRTGDLGRLLPDGNLEFVGRLDNQVKVNGLRVEVEEIETILRQHPSIREAIVVSKDDGWGNQKLAAYVVAREPCQPSQIVPPLRLFLKERVPKYMVPAEFVMLAEVPLNPNGKIDRSALRGRSDNKKPMSS